jgi:Cdc6-like AAA superfamily ATPase
MSKAIVIVGTTGTGKTTTVCNILKEIDIPKIIFDVNNEEKYKPFKNLWNKDFSFENFVRNATERKGTCIVFEEATIFFSHAGATTDIKKLLVQKRHTKNLLIFNFHSLRQVPLFILDFCDLLVLGKTNDNRKNIETKFKDFTEIYQAFNEAQADQNKYIKNYVRLIQA